VLDLLNLRRTTTKQMAKANNEAKKETLNKAIDALVAV